MKKLLSLIVALFAVLPVFAYDFEVNGIYYNKLSDNTVAVTYEKFSNSYSGDIIIPETVTCNNNTYSVTEIGNSAFNGCRELTSVSIPNSVTKICSNVFYQCYGLTSVSIPNSVTEIERGAFSFCSGLTSVSIPNSVTKIGELTFRGCYGLTSVSIPNSVTEIGREAFSGCSGLTSVSIPNSVTEIGSSAFYGCRRLTSVSIPNSVIEIGASAFDGCSGLTNLYIGENVNKIGSEAFYYCKSIEEIAVAAVVPPAANSYDTFESSVYANATLCVPKESIEAYKTTEPWSNFSTIKALDESEINAVSENSEAVFDICNLNGVLLKRGATQADIDTLTPGLYIVGGKKLLVK